MATRSTITLIDHLNTVSFYRHWDGYPECTGRHLAHATRGADCIEHIAAKLLGEGEGKPHGAGRYEFTAEPLMHSDREWHYEITTCYQQLATIRVLEQPIGSNMREVFCGDLTQYRAWVSDRFRAMIARYKARKAA
jgi:hypothetical protein